MGVSRLIEEGFAGAFYVECRTLAFYRCWAFIPTFADLGRGVFLAIDG